MRIVIEKTANAVFENAAERLAQLVQRRPNAVLGLATGRTMVGTYSALVRHHRDGLSLAGITTFNLDEYVGMKGDDPRSFHHFMVKHLVEPTDLPPSSLNMPDGHADDLFAEAARYEQAIDDAGGLDLQLLGMGRNGHIGFNEPGSSLRSLTRVKALTRDTLEANKNDLEGTNPEAALTMGLGTILNARSCLLLATGGAKAYAVKAMAEGPLTARVPASVLQLHRDVIVIVDEAAAALLDHYDYYVRAEKLQRQLEERHSP